MPEMRKPCFVQHCRTLNPAKKPFLKTGNKELFRKSGGPPPVRRVRCVLLICFSYQVSLVTEKIINENCKRMVNFGASEKGFKKREGGT
jgi:hypothetical protein